MFSGYFYRIFKAYPFGRHATIFRLSIPLGKTPNHVFNISFLFRPVGGTSSVTLALFYTFLPGSLPRASQMLRKSQCWSRIRSSWPTRLFHNQAQHLHEAFSAPPKPQGHNFHPQILKNIQIRQNYSYVFLSSARAPPQKV